MKFSLASWRRAASLSALLTLGAALVAPSVVAQNGATKVTGRAPAVQSQLTAFVVEKNGDKESFAPASNARPGDVIEYRAIYRNTGESAARNLRPTLPVPVGTSYVANSTAPSKFEASLDGQKFAPAPLTRTVKNPDGTTKVVPVPLSEYRALRWNAGTLEPGQSVTMKARVQIAKTG